MVASERALRHLERALADAEAGHSGGVVVAGPVGVGRSRLLAAVAASASEETVVLPVAGLPQERHLPHGALHRLLVPVLDRVPALPPWQARALGQVLGSGPADLASTPLDRHLAVDALLRSIRRPVLVLVDDAQDLDPATLDALAAVARRGGDGPVLVVLARREALVRGGDAPDAVVADLPHLRLDPPDRDATAAMLDRRGATVEAGVLEQVWAAVGGLPGPLLSVCEDLPASVRAGTLPLPDALPLDATTRRVVLGAAAGLDPAARHAALLVAAGDGDVATLARALDGAQVPWAAVEALERLGLVEVAGPLVRFAHPLLRTATYADADAPDRRAAHGRLAEAERRPHHRARHAGLATVRPDPAVAADLAAAARDAVARGRHGDGARLLQRAAELSEDVAARVEHRRAAAHALYLAGDGDLALALLEEARHATEDPVEQARVAQVQGQVELWLGRPASARQRLVDEVGRVEAADPDLADELRLLAAIPTLMLGEPTAAAALLDAASPADAAAPHGVADAAVRAQTCLVGGRFRQGRAHAADARARLGARSADQQVLDAPLVANALLLAGDVAEAAALAQGAVDRAARDGARAALGIALATLADARARQGRLADAVLAARRSVAACEAAGQETERAHALAVLARVEALLGDAGTEAHAREALAVSAASGAAAIVPFAHHALGSWHLARDRVEDAVAELTHAADVADAQGVVHPGVVPIGPDLVEALVRADHAGAALEQAERLQARATDLDDPLVLAAALRARALAGDRDPLDLLDRALDLLRPRGAAFEVARTTLVLGEHLRRAHHRARARELLARSAASFDRLGAAPWADRARSELRAAGGRAGGSLDDLAAPHDLSPQELRIATRVATGATNREVAAAFGISAKTVENTLTRVYAKVGVRSRSELTAWMRRGADRLEMAGDSPYRAPSRPA